MADRVEAVGEQTSLADRKRRAGQRLLIGPPGPSVDADTRALIREIRPAGFVLFARNVVEPRQVRDLIRELTSLCDPALPPLLAVDQEGGRVQRVRAPATVWPPMRAVGRSEGLTEDVSRAMAVELRAMGFNLNFAPVADVDSNPKNPIIGDRSFSHDPDEVARHVVAFVRGHQDEGLIACAKHFPGHGDTELDSHLHLPTVDRDRDELERCELRPFLAAVAAGVGSVMTSHVMYPAWDEESPATLSPRIIRALLRDGMAYDGVVFSDDLDMRAVADRWTMDEIVRGATEATVDLLLACNVQSRQYEAFEALVRDQETDRAGHRAAEDAVGRLHALRERFFLGAPRVPDLDRVGCHDHMVLAARASDRGGVA